MCGEIEMIARNSLKGLIVCMSLILILGAGSVGFAEEGVAAAPDRNVRKRNASSYDEMARGVNSPVYEYYARRIKMKTGITRGVCLDAGSGGGYLGLALARITDLDFIFLDISQNALDKAEEHIIEDGLQKRAKTLLADVHSIPLPDGSVNLVISRGSIHFWKDPGRALKEIYRILAPGGMTYIGGGKGTPEIQAQIKARLKAMGRPAKWSGKGAGQRVQRDYDAILKAAGIPDYEVITGGEAPGFWIVMKK